MTTTRTLAEFAVGLSWTDLSDGTVSQLKKLLLDFLGVSLFAGRLPWTKSLLTVLTRLGGEPTSTILVGGTRTSAPVAAFANGVLAHSADWDDSHIEAIVHPGAVVFPAALAVAEAAGCSGRDFILATVSGYEVAIRLGLAVQPSHMERGFHGTATCGVFGASVASARVFGLDAKAVAHAMGFAASFSGGLSQFFKWGSDIKRIHAGKSAHDGVLAALFAREGLSAPPAPIEGERGFFDAYAPVAAPERATDGLGRRFCVDDVMVKALPIAAHIHGAVDAAFQLGRELGVPMEAITEVLVEIDPVIARNNANPAPTDIQGAQMSLPFCVACAMWCAGDRARPLALADLEAGLSIAEVRSLAGKVRCVPTGSTVGERTTAALDSSLDAGVTIRLHGGRVLSRRVTNPKGTRANPFQWGDTVEKFRYCTEEVLSDTERRRLVEQVERLDELASVRGLTRIRGNDR
ncbi:MAG: MmgE/PrpD family protein [Candidatus Rokubacteria bacterium]|nr:MmgE/PrpD family protein [Candidatus Rokubacteria bacterium]